MIALDLFILGLGLYTGFVSRWMSVCASVCLYVYMCVYAYVCFCKCDSLFMCMRVCVCVCVCVHFFCFVGFLGGGIGGEGGCINLRVHILAYYAYMQPSAYICYIKIV